jgi:hypothetical protein
MLIGLLIFNMDKAMTIQISGSTLYTLLGSIVTAIVSIAMFSIGFFAHAADVERSNTQIMLELQQIGLDNRRAINSMYLEEVDDAEDLSPKEKRKYDFYREEEKRLREQQNQLEMLRRGIK